MLFRTAPTGRRFQLALIKPSHYDDDGYVIQWMRSIIPSNTLAVLYSLFQDSAARQALGSDVALDISVVDEITTRIRPNQIVKRFRRHDNFGLVIFAGVQTNQYPRTLDLARPLRDAGIPVAIGGFHVSGCLAMLPGLQPDLQEAIDMRRTYGQAAPLSIQASTSSPNLSCVPGTGSRPAPGCHAQAMRSSLAR